MPSNQQPERINLQSIAWDPIDPQEGGGAYDAHVLGTIDFTGDDHPGPVFFLSGSFSAHEVEANGAGVLQFLVNALEDEGHAVATVEVTYTYIVTNSGPSDADHFEFHLTATLENGGTTEITLDQDDLPEGTEIQGFAPWTTFNHILALIDDEAAAVTSDDPFLI